MRSRRRVRELGRRKSSGQDFLIVILKSALRLFEPVQNSFSFVGPKAFAL
jgi:hypothetical protein